MATINWKAAIWAGVIAGMIFMILEMIMVPLFMGGSPWGPPRMIAAIIMGEGVLPPPATFDIGILMVAVMLHLVMSIMYAIGIAFLVRNMGLGVALAIGTVIGLVIYFVNFYLFTGIFPWFAMARNWISIFSHAVFGLAAAWAYLALAHRTATAGKARVFEH